MKTLIGGIAALVVLAGVVTTATAQPPTPGLQYTFVQGTDDLTTPGGIHDQSPNGHNGTVINSAYAEFVAGPAGNMNAIHIDAVNTPDETDGSGINTGVMNNDPTINIFDGPYTLTAWCNLDDFGEHMVFGSPKPNAPGSGSADAGALHLGFRGSTVYFGWWGASVNRDSSIAYVGQPGEWHHIAWRFTGMDSGGSQDIFQDGVLFNSHQTDSWYGGILAENNNVPNVPTVLLIGRTVSNNGAFSGSLSDVRVYSTALSDDDIAAIAAVQP